MLGIPNSRPGTIPYPPVVWLHAGPAAVLEKQAVAPALRVELTKRLRQGGWGGRRRETVQEADRARLGAD